MGIFDFIRRQFGLDVKNYNGVNEEFSDKNLIKKYYRKNGKYHGVYQELLWSGNDRWPKLEINYKNGVIDGGVKYYFNGYLLAECVFVNGKESGIIKKYFRHENKSKDLQKDLVLHEFADLNEGEYIEYNSQGNILESSRIEGGFLSKAGESHGRGYFVSISPMRKGNCEKKFDNGNLKERGQWQPRENPTKNNTSYKTGTHFHYYENGNEFKKGKWINDNPTGKHQFFFTNGSLEFEVDYSSNFPEEKWFNEDGTLMESHEIINNKYIIHSHRNLVQESLVVINGMKFKRKGKVDFYGFVVTKKYNLGFKYELAS